MVETIRKVRLALAKGEKPAKRAQKIQPEPDDTEMLEITRSLMVFLGVA